MQVLRSDGATKELKVLIEFCVGKWQSETQLNVETFLPDGTDQVVYPYHLIATMLEANNGAILCIIYIEHTFIICIIPIGACIYVEWITGSFEFV